IMVSNDAGISTVKVTDFGIAKMAETEIDDVMNAGDDDSITGSKTVVGALPYMAPELIKSSKSAVLSADVWAFGALLYHLLVGERPFGKALQPTPRFFRQILPVKVRFSHRGHSFQH